MMAAGSLGDDERQQLRQQAQARIMQLLKQLDETAVDMTVRASRHGMQFDADQLSRGERALDGVILAARGIRGRLHGGDNKASK